MTPYLLKAHLQYKEPELRFDVCQVDHILELPEQAFREFSRNLLTDRDFLQEYNSKYAGEASGEVRPCLLVLGKGSDDGILVSTEGYDFARYSALVLNARQLLLLKDYPSLQDYVGNMAGLVDSVVQKAITVGLPEPFRISVDGLQADPYHAQFNTDLFLQMLSERPEIERIESDGDEICLTVSPDYLPQRRHPLRTLSEEDFKIACAKHLLWSYSSGGEQADFSNCNFNHVDFSFKELNGAIFDGAVLRECNLSDTSLCFASFKGCIFHGCDCRNLTAEEAIFQEAVFDQCNLNCAVMTHSDFTRAALQDCRMEHAVMNNCLIEGMKTPDTPLSEASLHGATEDAPTWFNEEPPDLSMEELQ